MCFVDFHHFARFADYWLETGSDIPADLYEDEDYAIKSGKKRQRVKACTLMEGAIPQLPETDKMHNTTENTCHLKIDLLIIEDDAPKACIYVHESGC
ncbi:MAG: hypothetical protein ACYSTG_07585 [Planctomycetota bacterium]